MSSVIYYTEILANLFLGYFLKVYGNRKEKNNFDLKLHHSFSTFAKFPKKLTF